MCENVSSTPLQLAFLRTPCAVCTHISVLFSVSLFISFSCPSFRVYLFHFIKCFFFPCFFDVFSKKLCRILT